MVTIPNNYVPNSVTNETLTKNHLITISHTIVNDSERYENCTKRIKSELENRGIDCDITYDEEYYDKIVVASSNDIIGYSDNHYVVIIPTPDKNAVKTELAGQSRFRF